MEVDIAMIDKKISDIFLDKKATTIQEAKQLRQKIYMLEQKREELIAELEQLQPQHKTRELYLDRNIEQSAGEHEVINYNICNFGSKPMTTHNQYEKNPGEEIAYNEKFYPFYGPHEEYRHTYPGTTVIGEISRHYNKKEPPQFLGEPPQIFKKEPPQIFVLRKTQV